MNLKPEVLNTIKNYLEKEKKEVEARLRSINSEDPFSQVRTNRNAAPDDDATEFAGHDRALVLKQETSRFLARIKKSLAKIGVGTYGKCDRCGNPIDEARLKVMPMADLCFECERKKEQ